LKFQSTQGARGTEGVASAWPHYLSLCAGGANAIENLWPEPLAEAHEKDKVEAKVCRALVNGSMTQAEAIALINEW
jgi:hypothetical protein